MRCIICGDPVKRCGRRRTNYLCHTWKHDHRPRISDQNDYASVPVLEQTTDYKMLVIGILIALIVVLIIYTL